MRWFIICLSINSINKDNNLSDSEKAKQIKILEDNNNAIDEEFNIIATEINSGADGYKSASGIQVVVKENMLENQRTQIATHEVGHYVFDKIFLTGILIFSTGTVITFSANYNCFDFEN